MSDSRIFGITEALYSLVPGAQWTLVGDDISGLEWLDESQEMPSYDAIDNEIIRLQSEYDSMSYFRNRAREYPDFKDYLDGIVKGDQDQIDAYINACLEVKAKYPKP